MKALTDSLASFRTTSRTASSAALPKIAPRFEVEVRHTSWIHSPTRLVLGAITATKPNNKQAMKPVFRCRPAFHSSGSVTTVVTGEFVALIECRIVLATEKLGARKKTQAMTTARKVIAQLRTANTRLFESDSEKRSVKERNA